MAVKKDKPRPPPSPKQRAVLLYGQRLRGLGNVGELIKHLTDLGHSRAAQNVRLAVMDLKDAAKREYESKRLELDPEFETSTKRWARLLKEDDERRKENE